jgi:hypothetical protein
MAVMTAGEVAAALEASSLERDERWVVERAFYAEMAGRFGEEYAQRWFIALGAD